MKKLALSVLFFLGVAMIGAAILIGTWEPPQDKIVKDRLDDHVDEARSLVTKAKGLYQHGVSANSVSELEEARTLCQKARTIIEDVRTKAGDPEPNRTFSFEELDAEAAKVLVLTRKALLERS